MFARNVLKGNLKIIVGLLLIFNFSAIFSQKPIEKTQLKTLQHSIFVTQTFQKFDNFSSINWSVSRKNLFFLSSIGVGANRTFYQKRFFPQLQFGIGYKAITLNKMSISPEFSVIASTFTTIERHYFSSFLAGYFFQYGGRIYLIHRFNVGVLNEKFKTSLGNINSANTIDWQFSLGVGYAFY